MKSFAKIRNYKDMSDEHSLCLNMIEKLAAQKWLSSKLFEIFAQTCSSHENFGLLTPLVYITFHFFHSETCLFPLERIENSIKQGETS